MVKFIKDNWIGILGLLFGLSGIIVSIYFYQKTQENREPYYWVENRPSIILSSEKMSDTPIKVIRKNGKEITSSLYLLRFYFWNAGEKPIKKEDILKSITVEIADTTSEIIDAKLLSISRDVTGIELNKAISKGKISKLDIDFDILEKNDGFGAQIIYEGDRSDSIKFDGVIEGAKLKPSTGDDSFGDVLIRLLIFLMISTTLIILTSIFEKLPSKIREKWGDEIYYSKLLQTISKTMEYILSLVLIILVIALLVRGLSGDSENEFNQNIPTTIIENTEPN